MEDLIQFVAESFARHGIECQASESQTTESVRPVEAPIPVALPEHNYRKGPDVDFAP
jgi:hypothetical protein